MDLNQEIRAQLDQNEAANMLAKVGLSLQNCSTERDLQLLVADYRLVIIHSIGTVSSV